jgi:hypothetical protein
MEEKLKFKRVKYQNYTYWIDNNWKCFIWKYPGSDPVYYYFDEPLGIEILNNGIFYN